MAEIESNHGDANLSSGDAGRVSLYLDQFGEKTLADDGMGAPFALQSVMTGEINT